MTNVGDAVARGIVASLARPGGNITGDTFYVTELVAKRLEVLKSAIPGLRRVAALVNPDNALAPLYQQAMDVAARELGIALLTFQCEAPRTWTARSPRSRRTASTRSRWSRTWSSSPVQEDRGLAVKQRLPSISFVEYPDAGGSSAYGVDFLALYRRAPSSSTGSSRARSPPTFRSSDRRRSSS